MMIYDFVVICKLWVASMTSSALLNPLPAMPTLFLIDEERRPAECDDYGTVEETRNVYYYEGI